MAKAIGRRPDETESEQSQRHGPETWALAVIAALMVVAMIGLIALAA